MKTLKTPLLVLSLALAPACAKKNTDTQPVVAAPTVAGEFTKPCAVTARNQGQLMALTFDAADNFTNVTQNFNDATCTDGAFEQVMKGHYKLGAQTSTAGIFNFDLVATEVSLIPYTRRMADEWNRTRFCRIGDWQEGRATVVPDPAGCGLNVNLNEQVYTLVKIVDANTLEFGMANVANRNEDGLAPERRFSLIDDRTVYTRKGSQQPAQPGHNQPNPDAQCPLILGHSYACDTRGEDPFSGRDLHVSANNIQGGFEFILDLSRPNENMVTQRYEADGQTRTSQDGSFRKDVTDACVRGELISKTVISRQGDASTKTIERHFRVAGNNDLLIDTATTELSEPGHSGQTTGVRTQCRVLR